MDEDEEIGRREGRRMLLSDELYFFYEVIYQETRDGENVF